MTINFSTGDILNARKGSTAFHPIIYIGERNKDSFIGCIITHSNNYDNIPMSQNHFEIHNTEGDFFNLQFDSTFLVKAKLIKNLDLLPFEKVGELTEEGIKFITENIGAEYEKYWTKYLIDSKTKRKNI